MAAVPESDLPESLRGKPVPDSDLPESLRGKPVPASDLPFRVPPEVQKQRDEAAIRILQKEYLQAAQKLQDNPNDVNARENVKELARELAAKGGQIPTGGQLPPEPPAAPPSAASAASSPMANAARQALGEASAQTGVKQEALLGGLGGLAAGLAETRGFGPASIVEKAVAGAQKGMGPAAPVGGPAGPVGGPVGPLSAPVTPPGGGIIPSGGPDAGRLAAGQTGTMPYNYAKAAGLTDIEAARALDMTKQPGGVHDLTSARREALQKIQQMGGGFAENPRFGGLMTPEQGVGGGPRQSFAYRAAVPPSPEVPSGLPGGFQQLPKTAPIPTTPAPASGLDQVTQMFKNMAEKGARGMSAVGGAARALPVLSYPLAGYSIGSDIGDIQQQLARKSPDYADIVLKGLGALGTGMSLHPATAPVGIPLAVGSPMMAAARKKIMAMPTGEKEPVSAEELVTASQPAFGFYRNPPYPRR